jgi:hypothetical protein
MNLSFANVLAGRLSNVRDVTVRYCTYFKVSDNYYSPNMTNSTTYFIVARAVRMGREAIAINASTAQLQSYSLLRMF